MRQRYGIEVEVYFPDAAQVREHGAPLRRPTSSRRRVQARLLCCNVRKVEPIRGVLEGLDAWITGLRRDQWASRANIRKIEIDHDHGGLAKINPLADWTLDEVKDYNAAHDVPVPPALRQGLHQHRLHPLHPRRRRPGEDPRAGRWWWEKNAPKECGIHCPIETGAFEHELEALLHPGRRRGPRLSAQPWPRHAPAAALALDPVQREVLLEELATLVVSLRDAEARAPWEELAAAVDAGGVEEDCSAG